MFMVVENVRLPAAVGVICASDANDVRTCVLSPQEQTVINKVIQQFTTIQNTQATNLNQVINIINNVTLMGQEEYPPPQLMTLERGIPAAATY
jgi:ribonucleotide reductase beta subunit family protein with ferritin-like domain